nr:HAMP domain-containing protein [uncultured Rhodoferax sp.]
MNIRQRLILLIALTFAALGSIGAFAVFQSKDSTIEVRSVTEGVVPSALASVELMSQLKDVQIATLAMVSAKEQSEVMQTLEALAGKKRDLDKALQTQLAQADSTAQKGLIAQAQESLVNYFTAIDDTAKFKLAGQQEMAEVNMAATVDQFLREQISIIETVQIEKRRSKDEAIAAVNRNMANTSTTLTLITTLAILALTGVGVFLYRQITIPLQDMQEKMTEIATSQDFTHRVPVTRNDEIGRSVTAFNAMIEKIQESSELVKQKSADIHAMMHNIPQGILTILPGNVVHPEYSSFLESILDTKNIAGRQLMDLVFADTECGADILSQIETAVTACIGEDSMNLEFNSHLLVQEIVKTLPDGRTKVLDLNWSPICDDNDTIVRLMLCIWDVTDLRQLEAQAAGQKREMAIIGEILAINQEKFHSFVESANQFLHDNTALLDTVGETATAANHSEAIALLFRNMHTIKGNARTYGLLHLTNLVHEAEETYDAMRKDVNAVWDIARMRDQLDRVATVLQEYVQVNDVKLGRKGPGRRGGVERFLMVEKTFVETALGRLDTLDRTDAHAMAGALDRLRHELHLLGTESIENALSGVIDSLPSLAQELGKEPPRVVIDSNGIVVRKQIVDLLKNVGMHLYRNALDHGLESAQDRVAAGKAAQGCIRLSLGLDSDGFTLRLSDDGRGMAVDVIRKKALASGLIDADAALTAQQIAQLIFQPGFSTAQAVTEVSGRGVGMDAVKGFIQSEGGTIALHFTDDQAQNAYRSFETVITLPAKCAERVIA